MAKLFLKVENEKRKVASLSGNETLDIDIMVGNSLLASLAVRRYQGSRAHDMGYEMVDDNGQVIASIENRQQAGQKAKGDCDIDDTSEHLCIGVGCKNR